MEIEETIIVEEEQPEEPVPVEDIPENTEPEDTGIDAEECVNKVGNQFLDKLAVVLSKGKVTINLVLYTLMGIIVSPFIDAIQDYIGTGIADFAQFFNVIKYVAAPFVMLIATKRIMDDLAEKGESTKRELASCRKELRESEQRTHDVQQQAALREERLKSKYQLEIQQREGIISLKNYEIERLNTEIKLLKQEIHLIKNGITVGR
jgi:hypothetical protein